MIAAEAIGDALQELGEPIAIDALAARLEVPLADVHDGLLALLVDREGVIGPLLDDPAVTAACWWEPWCERQADWLDRERAALEQAVRAEAESADTDPRSPAAEAWQNYLVNRFSPPRGKRILAIFQDAVRRPFSSAPSHASLRQAVRLATGCDPSHDLFCCPVHVVVLASHLGPVPYELEDLWPASCRSTGVKQLSDQVFADRLPLLAGRLAEYLERHASCYDTTVAFAHGRYGEVVRASGFRGPVLPRPGETITRVGDKVPHTYWQKHWVQLFRGIADGLEPWRRSAAEIRLRQAGVETRRA